MTYKFFKQLFLHIKYWKIIKKIYKEENIIENLSQLLKINLKVDWVGRIYAVLNPTINDMGQFDSTKQIYEYGESGLNNNIYVERWLMGNLNVASKFIVANNLFELLTYDIKKIDEYDNYLLVIQPITLPPLFKYLKYLVFEWVVILVAGIITYIYI